MTPPKSTAETINIVIDDAGSGNFVGGMIIAGYSDVLDKYESHVIDVDEYNENFREMQQSVLNAVLSILKRFSDYNINYVFMCQSSLFDLSTTYLVKKGFFVVRGKVEGNLQDLIELDFLNYLQKLGLPEYINFFFKIIDKDKNSGYKMLNNFCINYVKVDKENRLKLCKIHSKLYNDINETAVSKIEVENVPGTKKKRLCANCGKYIKSSSMYKIVSLNNRNIFYTHINCEE